MDDAKKIIFLREGGPVASIISDSYTFGLLVGSVWFNHHFVGGSYFLNAVLLVMFFLFLIGKLETKKEVFQNLSDLMAYLQKEVGR